MMFNGFCHFGTWGSLGNFGIWGWVGYVLNLVLWIGLFAGLILMVIWALRRAQAPAVIVPYATGKPTTKEILQAQYARGEISPEEYERRKQDIG